MSLNKNEFEYMRLYAQKCDHRNMAPVASFDLAADLRAHKGRGGRMFEKRMQCSQKYAADTDNHHLGPDPGSSQRSQLFAAHPAIWRPSSKPSKPSYGRITDMDFMDRMNQNNAQQDDAGSVEDNLTDSERLQKLYRILRYVPPEDALPKRVMKAPKVDLKSRAQMTMLLGRDFNRNAKGWCAVEGNLQETGNLTPLPEHPSGWTTEDMDNYYFHYYYYSPTDLSPDAQEPALYPAGGKPRPKSWHSVRMEDIGSQDEVPMGDYNPRPKAWQPVYDDLDCSRALGPAGDYNPRPKAWQSNEAEDILRGEVHYGDYNPRPKAWRSKHRKATMKDQQKHFGDYNPRPKAWKSSKRGHYHLQAASGDSSNKVKFGDYNARAKAWKATNSGKSGLRSKARYGDYNARAKAWRSAPEDDSSSTSSYYSSTEDSDDDYSYGSSLYSSGCIGVSDV